MAIDADYVDALRDLLRLRTDLQRDGVEPALEGSRRGGHLWIFLAKPLPARDCRIYVYGLALRLGIPIKGGKRREGIEVFPKHDSLKPGRYGNAIRGPLGIHRGAGRRFWFEGAGPDLDEQMHFLASLPKLTGEQLARLIANRPVPPQLALGESRAEQKKSRDCGGPEFRILDHIHTRLRTVGHNQVTRCPSCAEEGHDRSRDNLSISIEDPRKYICWAGCSREMIRAAVGWPRPIPLESHNQKKEEHSVEIR